MKDKDMLNIANRYQLVEEGLRDQIGRDLRNVGAAAGIAAAGVTGASHVANNMHNDIDAHVQQAESPDESVTLSSLGLKIVEGREDDDDRYWETWEIVATTSEAQKAFGHGAIDWSFQSEYEGISVEELEQKVLKSLKKYGKPRFTN
jgi:hypothetical protein